MIAIAQLAGYLRRAGEGPPGFECWWKGYAILRSMVKIMHRHHASKSKPRRPILRSKSVGHAQRSQDSVAELSPVAEATR